jgi:hypothetical protein
MLQATALGGTLASGTGIPDTGYAAVRLNWLTSTLPREHSLPVLCVVKHPGEAGLLNLLPNSCPCVFSSEPGARS